MYRNFKNQLRNSSSSSRIAGRHCEYREKVNYFLVMACTIDLAASTYHVPPVMNTWRPFSIYEAGYISVPYTFPRMNDLIFSNPCKSP